MTVSIRPGAPLAPHSLRCVLNRTENYLETLVLTPLEVPPGSFELQVVSQLREARDPEAEHVRWRSIVRGEVLRSLRETLERAALVQPVEGGLNMLARSGAGRPSAPAETPSPKEEQVAYDPKQPETEQDGRSPSGSRKDARWSADQDGVHS
jgi:hypothetical protein